MKEFISNLLSLVIPPPVWRVPVTAALALLCGLVVFLLYASNAFSYLSDQPETCINCHIMAPEFASWSRSSHQRIATCNDCHVPQDNIFSHYYFKGKDGLRHSTIFTLRLEPQAIQIKEAGRDVVHENCKRCHWDLVLDTSLHKDFNNRVCWDCHRETPHGRVKSLSSFPYTQVPLLKSITPEWLKFLRDKDTRTK